MRSALAWVLGKGGLLGSHLTRALARGLPEVACWDGPEAPFCWSDATVLPGQLARAVTAFARAVRAERRNWLVLWAAGRGVIGSPQAALEAETDTWRLLLGLLGSHLLDGPQPIPGVLFLTSSAGAIFGPGPDSVLTEASPCRPVSDYGCQKLLQEEALRTWAEGRAEVGYVIGRLTNVYGPGQNLTKPQGLIAHLSRCLIYQRPAHLYVPLDTIRDYLFAEDCAGLIVQCARRALQAGPGCRVVKVIASGETTSVAQIVGVFGRLARRHPRIVCSPSPLASQQPRKLQFRSAVWPDLQPWPRTSLAVGIRRVHQHQLALFSQGQLLPPAPPHR